MNTSWASIRHLTGRDIDPPYAYLRPEAAERLTYALAQGRDPLCWFALWKGYAEVLQELPPVPAPPPDLLSLIRTAIEPLTVPDARPTDALLIQEPLSWLTRQAGEQGCCAPLLIHAADGGFTAACPIYHDSIYLGGSKRFIEQVIASRPETFEIELDSHTGIRGDPRLIIPSGSSCAAVSDNISLDPSLVCWHEVAPAAAFPLCSQP